MASRHLKKLQQQDFVLQEAESDDSPPAAAAARPNLFELLDEDSGEGRSGDDDDDESTVVREYEQSSALADSRQPEAAGKKSRKKKRGKKSKQGGQEEEDLDKLLQSLNIHVADSSEYGQGKTSNSNPVSVLTLNYKRLKPQDELRRIFGSKIISQEDRSEDSGINTQGASRRIRRMAQRGMLKKVQLKEGIIISPRYDWPKPDDALRMERDNGSEGKNCFKYVHSNAYKIAEEHFRQAQMSHNPNAITGLLQHHPYHIGTLLACSDLYRASGQHETADDFLSRALYVMEMAWPQSFSLGSCVLEYDLPENEPLFKALFQHIRSLIKRGLFTTALENAKAVLTLNPHDPWGILLCVDFIALKAGAYQFLQLPLQDFALEQQEYVEISLPNWAFSLPLSTFLAQQEVDQAGRKKAAMSDLYAERRPDFTIENALLSHPDAIPGLWERLEAGGSKPDKGWQEVLRHKFFRDASNANNAGYCHALAIFLERQLSLYKDAKLQQWLLEACQKVLEDQQAVKEAVSRNKLQWPASQENPWQHLRLAAFSDNEAALPQEALQKPREYAWLKKLPMQAAMEEGNAAEEQPPILPLLFPEDPLFMDIVDEALQDANLPLELRASLERLRDDPDTPQRLEDLGDAGVNGNALDEELLRLIQQVIEWVAFGRAD